MALVAKRGLHLPPLLVLAMKPTPQASLSFVRGSGPSNMLDVSPSLRSKAIDRAENEGGAWSAAKGALTKVVNLTSLDAFCAEKGELFCTKAVVSAPQKARSAMVKRIVIRSKTATGSKGQRRRKNEYQLRADIRSLTTGCT